ncbi:MAG: hypothetical protein WA717_01125, partial [Methyloceanibacter sp.]
GQIDSSDGEIDLLFRIDEGQSDLWIGLDLVIFKTTHVDQKPDRVMVFGRPRFQQLSKRVVNMQMPALSTIAHTRSMFLSPAITRQRLAVKGVPTSRPERRILGHCAAVTRAIYPSHRKRGPFWPALAYSGPDEPQKYRHHCPR